MDITKKIYKPWKQTNEHKLVTNLTLQTKFGTSWIIYREEISDTTSYSQLLHDNDNIITEVKHSCRNTDDNLRDSDFDIRYANYSPNESEKYNEITN
tara:strand:+ start:421 stop:711 length:291 start_codon:yes stop_codon:yes gene_type:complete